MDTVLLFCTRSPLTNDNCPACAARWNISGPLATGLAHCDQPAGSGVNDLAGVDGAARYSMEEWM